MKTAHALSQSAASASVVRAALFAVCGALALTVSAKIQIPYLAVPATLQTLVVLLLGMLARPQIAVAAVLLYLVQGAAGLPVFAGSVAGPAYFVGPTAGFLLGFLSAVALAGWCAKKGMTKTLPAAFAVALLAEFVIFLCGLSWLAFFLGDFQKAVAVGFIPFVGIEAGKIVIAACVAFKFARR